MLSYTTQKKVMHGFTLALESKDKSLKTISVWRDKSRPPAKWRRLTKFYGQYPNTTSLAEKVEDGTVWLFAKTVFTVDDLVDFAVELLRYCNSRLNRKLDEKQRERLRRVYRKHGVEPKF